MRRIFGGTGYIAGGIAAALLLAAAWDAARLARIASWNECITQGRGSTDPTVPPRVRLAAAYEHAARGRLQEAFVGYRELEGAADVAVRRTAKFNGATLYLQQSMAQRADDPGAAFALVELAKQSYRELLRDDPGDWDARYNLERALRLSPDAPEGEPDLPPPPDSRHTPSNARGVSLGLP